MAWVWDTSPSEAFNPMYDRKHHAIYNATYQLAQRMAPDIANWMKENKIWENRTGNAQQGLACDVVAGPDAVILVLVLGRHPNGGFLSYGRFLELGMGGRFSIIGPAVDHWAPKVLANTRALLR
jgi:hypothetical protein